MTQNKPYENILIALYRLSHLASEVPKPLVHRLAELKQEIYDNVQELNAGTPEAPIDKETVQWMVNTLHEIKQHVVGESRVIGVTVPVTSELFEEQKVRELTEMKEAILKKEKEEKSPERPASYGPFPDGKVVGGAFPFAQVIGVKLADVDWSPAWDTEEGVPQEAREIFKKRAEEYTDADLWDENKSPQVMRSLLQKHKERQRSQVSDCQPSDKIRKLKPEEE